MWFQSYRTVNLNIIVIFFICCKLALSQKCDSDAPHNCSLNVKDICYENWDRKNIFFDPDGYSKTQCLLTQQKKASLKSKNACSTENRLHCLTFYYKSSNFDSGFYLYIVTVNNKTGQDIKTTSVTLHKNQIWHQHHENINTSVDFTVVLTLIVPDVNNHFSIDEIEYVKRPCDTITTATQNDKSTVSRDDTSGTNAGGIAAAVIVTLLVVILVVVLVILYRRGKLPFLKKLANTNNSPNCLGKKDDRGQPAAQQAGNDNNITSTKDVCVRSPLELQDSTCGPLDGDYSNIKEEGVAYTASRTTPHLQKDTVYYKPNDPTTAYQNEKRDGSVGSHPVYVNQTPTTKEERGADIHTPNYVGESYQTVEEGIDHEDLYEVRSDNSVGHLSSQVGSLYQFGPQPGAAPSAPSPSATTAVKKLGPAAANRGEATYTNQQVTGQQSAVQRPGSGEDDGKEGGVYNRLSEDDGPDDHHVYLQLSVIS